MSKPRWHHRDVPDHQAFLREKPHPVHGVVLPQGAAQPRRQDRRSPAGEGGQALPSRRGGQALPSRRGGRRYPAAKGERHARPWGNGAASPPRGTAAPCRLDGIPCHRGGTIPAAKVRRNLAGGQRGPGVRFRGPELWGAAAPDAWRGWWAVSGDEGKKKMRMPGGCVAGAGRKACRDTSRSRRGAAGCAATQADQPPVLILRLPGP